MKRLILSLFFIGLVNILLTPSLSADESSGQKDYIEGMAYYDKGEYLQAFKALGRASKEGNHDAQYQIGLMYLEGKGIKANPEEAAYWFRKAGSNGHCASQFEIGYCFAHGIGVQADNRIAAEWFWRAAEQGDPDAAYYLATMFRDGKGVNVNIEKARKYFSQAAKAGLPEAKEELDKLPAPAPKASVTKTGKARPAQKRSGK